MLAAFALLLVRSKGGFSSTEFTHLLLILGFGMACFFILRILTGNKKSYKNSLITCLILYLLIDPIGTTIDFDFPTITLLIIVAVAFSLRFLLEVGGRSAFNPAVLAIFIGLLFAQFLPQMQLTLDMTRLEFNQLFSVGGIGISLTALLFAIWIFWGLPKWGRVFTLVSFFLVAGLIAYFQGRAAGVTELFTEGPFLYFFASFLLTDQKTSPDDHLLQWAYGGVVAVLIFLPEIIPLPSGSITQFWKDNMYFIGLLLANFGLFVYTAARTRIPVSR